MGRLVENHSTHIEGLIKWLRKIAEIQEIQTVTPASLSRTKGRGEKLIMPALDCLTDMEADEGTWKLLSELSQITPTDIPMSSILLQPPTSSAEYFVSKSKYRICFMRNILLSVL